MRAAHLKGLRSTATLMFGVGEEARHRVNHFLRLRELQDETQGFTAFICWTFQPENTRLEPSDNSAHAYLRVNALARLVLDNVPNFQASWVTMGGGVAQAALHMGCNDFGSVMIEENVVSRRRHHLPDGLGGGRAAHPRRRLPRRPAATCATSWSGRRPRTRRDGPRRRRALGAPRTGRRRRCADGAVALDGDVVVEVGPRAEVEARHGPAERLDAVILPALVNAHLHLELSHLAGEVPGGGGLVPWIEALVGPARPGRRPSRRAWPGAPRRCGRPAWPRWAT